MRLRPLSLAAAVLLLLVLAYTAWWSAAANGLRDALVRWAEEARAAGTEVVYRDLAVGGFPAQLRVTATDLRLGRGTGAGFATGRLSVQTRPWDPRRVVVEVPGPSDWTLPTPPGVPPVTLAVARLSGEATVAWPPPTAHTGEAGRLTLTALDVALPASANLPWDDPIARIELTARLLGAPPQRLTTAELSRWSGDGGTLEIDRLDLAWGRLDLRGDGTLTLDGRLQPIGAGAADIGGVDALLDGLVATGRMQPGSAALAKAGFALIARPDARGVPVVKVPVTLQDGVLSLGPAPVLTVPEIAWP